MKFHLIALLLMMIPASSFADCTTPAAIAGEISYNSNVLQFCDGTSWTTMGSTVGAVCSSAGEITYANDPTMEYCDNTNWISVKCIVGAVCSTNGEMRYSSGDVEYCDGTNWYSTSNSC